MWWLIRKETLRGEEKHYGKLFGKGFVAAFP
jgi:hypothetical protein